MPTRQVPSAIILAAGRGRRMGRLTADRPKALIVVGGEPLIDRQLASLEACGIRDVTVVVGYAGARLRAHLGSRVTCIENPRYDETNSLYSLWLARDRLRRGAVVLNADVLAPTVLLERLTRAAAPDAVLIDRRGTLEPEDMKVRLWLDLVLEFSKTLERADGEHVGIAKFGAAGGRRLMEVLEALVASGHEQAWAPLAFGVLAAEWPLRAVFTEGMPWSELDTPEDLDRAERTVSLAIRRLEGARRLSVLATRSVYDA